MSPRLLGWNKGTKGQGRASKAGRAAPKRGMRRQNSAPRALARGQQAAKERSERQRAPPSQQEGAVCSQAAALYILSGSPPCPPLLTRALALVSWQRLRGQCLLGDHERGRGKGPHPPTRPDYTEGGHRTILEIDTATQILPQSASAPAMRPVPPLLAGGTSAKAVGAAGESMVRRAYRSRL